MMNGPGAGRTLVSHSQTETAATNKTKILISMNVCASLCVQYVCIVWCVCVCLSGNEVAAAAVV